jgi:hypothetical protein
MIIYLLIETLMKKKTLIWGPPMWCNDKYIYYFVSLDDLTNECFQCFCLKFNILKKFDFNHRVRKVQN